MSKKGPKDPEEDVAALNRRIAETCQLAERTFRRALDDVKKAESAQPKLSREPPASARVDAVIAKYEREIRALRTSGPERAATWEPEAARERLEELGRSLEELAKRRDTEAAHAAEWERRAMMAVSAENDELALEALERKREHDRSHRLFAREHEYAERITALLRELLAAT